MIWVFDSGLWWKLTLNYIREVLPHYDYLYLWDTKYLPYGDKDADFLKNRTFACLTWMFNQGCELVILACNTASAYAIRPWQEQYPDHKVLSVTIPWVEKVIELWVTKPVLFATDATIRSGIYSSVTHRLHPWSSLVYLPLPWKELVMRIEQNISTYEYLQYLFNTVREEEYDAVVLWCTHYPIVEEAIQQIVGKRIPLINPWYEAAQSLVRYLEKHTELNLKRWWEVVYYYTWSESEWETLFHVDI